MSILPCRSKSCQSSRPALKHGCAPTACGPGIQRKVSAINSMVDTVTRNVGVQATLENPDHTLKPGMFVKVDVMLPEKGKTMVVPGSAVSYAP